MEKEDVLAVASRGFTEALAAASAELSAKKEDFDFQAAGEALSKGKATAEGGLSSVRASIAEVKAQFSLEEFAESLQGLIKSCAGSKGGMGCFAGCVASKADREAELRKIDGEWAALSAKITDCMADSQSALERVGKSMEDVARSAQPTIGMLSDLPEELKSKAETVKSPDDVLNFDLGPFRSAVDVSAVTGGVASVTTAVEHLKANVLKSKLVCSETEKWLASSKKAIKKVATPSALEGCLAGMAGGKGAVETAKAAVQKLDGMMEAILKLEKSFGSTHVSLPNSTSLQQDATVPLKEFSAFATTKLDTIGEAQEGAKAAITKAKEARKLAKVAEDLKRGDIGGAASLAKGFVSDTFNTITAEGKEARGADRDSSYRFGDVTRGIAKKFAEGKESN